MTRQQSGAKGNKSSCEPRARPSSSPPREHDIVREVWSDGTLQITFVNGEFTRVTSAREANRLRPRQGHQYRSYIWVCTAGLDWLGRANETRIGTEGGRQGAGLSRPIVNTNMTNRLRRGGQCKGNHWPSSSPSPPMESFSGLTM